MPEYVENVNPLRGPQHPALVYYPSGLSNGVRYRLGPTSLGEVTLSDIRTGGIIAFGLALLAGGFMIKALVKEGRRSWLK